MPAPTGFILDQRYCDHDTGGSHPERPDRIRAIERQLTADGLLHRLRRLEPVAAELRWIERIHSRRYIERVRKASETGAPFIDTPDSVVSHASFEVARLAVGGVLVAIDGVMRRQVANAFCAVRPPGHHAEHDLSMGFCLFNNVAVAARYVQEQWHVKRVLILDWDVHHGNGTQHAFESDPTIFFCSMHEHPRYLYPGSGFPSETGKGAGEGYTLNLAMMPGAGDSEYREAYESSFVPAVEAFKPEFILVSAGFDAHQRDPLAHLELTDEGFAWLTEQTLALADRFCNGRLVSTLEGGYDLDALARCVSLHAGLLARMRRPS